MGEQWIARAFRNVGDLPRSGRRNRGALLASLLENEQGDPDEELTTSGQFIDVFGENEIARLREKITNLRRKDKHSAHSTQQSIPQPQIGIGGDGW